MLALQINSMKHFMNHLLVQDTFDLFLLEEATLRTANTYQIDGHMNTKFFSKEELEQGIPAYDFQPWSEIKGLCFHLIKGKNTPLYFKFVFQLKPEKSKALLTKSGLDMDVLQLKALLLNIRYDGTKNILTTGSSYHTFVLNKEPDQIWDKTLTSYLDSKGIAYSLL